MFVGQVCDYGNIYSISLYFGKSSFCCRKFVVGHFLNVRLIVNRVKIHLQLFIDSDHSCIVSFQAWRI